MRRIRQVAKMANVSMTVQRGNAASIMGTRGHLGKLEDFFDVSHQEKRNQNFNL